MLYCPRAYRAREEKPELEPLRTDTLTIAGEAYEAAYFGEQDISEWSDYASREFWRVEGGYDAFSAWQTTGDQLPESNYPMAAPKRILCDPVPPAGRRDHVVVRCVHRPDGLECWRRDCAGNAAGGGLTIETKNIHIKETFT